MRAKLHFADMMHYLVAIGEVPDRAVTIREFEKLIGALGFKFYCFFDEPKPVQNAAQLIISANWPAGWTDRYVGKKYLVIDPVIRYLLRTSRSFSWEQAIDAYRDSPQYRRMHKMVQDARSFGLVSGYVFPVFGRNGLMGATSVAGSTHVDLSPAQLLLFETATRATYLKLLELNGGTRADLLTDAADITLTYREVQALSNMADGLTSSEIAAVLEVAPTTVDWYGASLQEKLGARNRNHAVALGLRRGLIS